MKMNTFRRLLESFRRQRQIKRSEKIERLKDEYYDVYYTNCAKIHINKVLESYNRPSHNTYQSSLDSLKNIGLYNPCSDNINYLKHMRWASLKYKVI